MKDRFFGLFGQTNKFKTVDAKEFATFVKDTVNLTFLEGTYTKIANETLPKDKPVALYCRRKQDYPCRSFLAVGNYYMEPKVLKIVREDIELGDGDFDRIRNSSVPHLDSMQMDHI